MTRSNLVRAFYIFSMAGVALSLPLSVWFLSVFSIMVFISWLTGMGWRKAGLLLAGKRSTLVFSAIYLVYLLWMLNTSDLNEGLSELKQKLPLLLFPVVISLSAPPGEKEFRLIIFSFITGVIISSVYGVITRAHYVFSGYADPRTLSPFISHIRLSLMAVFAIFLSGWFFTRSKGWNWEKTLLLMAAIWLVTYLFLLFSLTGIIIFGIALIISLYIYILRSGKKILKIIFPVTLFIAACAILLVISGEVRAFYEIADNQMIQPSAVTKSGNVYTSDPAKREIENGNRVWINVCEKELRQEWNRISHVGYDSTDRAGQEIKYTLIRYLTSAGLNKDSAGVAKLDNADIANIENGLTNRLFTVWNPIKKKMYEIIWQIDYYRNGGNPSRHSITQRIEFLRTGWRIFRSVPLAGTGTGNIRQAYADRYEKDHTMLEKGFRHLCHNQYLTFLVSFGILGTSVICLALFFPFLISGSHRKYLPAIFFLIIILSMLWEDTLETHTGITFFSYFYSLLIFGADFELTNDDKRENK